MLWFKYRWLLAFSHGLCVKIVRGGDAVKRFSSDIDSLFRKPMSVAIGRNILSRTLRLIDILEDIIFSTSALLYREEKDLIRFSRRVEDAARKLIGKLRKEKGKYGNDAKKLEDMMSKLGRKKQDLPKGSKIKLDKEGIVVKRDEEKKNEMVSLLHELTSFIEEMDSKIHHIHLEAKSQRRKTFNTYKMKENIVIRSNFRLGELTGRKGIESSALIKRIRQKLHHFGRIVGRGKKLDHGKIIELLKYCRMEASDLKNVFLFVIQVSERIGERLNRLGGMTSKEPKLRSLIAGHSLAKKRLNILRRDIQTQYRRLDNEFKKRGFVPNAQIQREIKRVA